MFNEIEKHLDIFDIDKANLDFEILDDSISIDFQKAIWFDGVVLRGTYKGINFEISSPNTKKEVRLFRTQDEVIGDILDLIKSEDYTINKFKDFLSNYNLPIEDETVYALTNDINGINNIVGYFEYEDTFDVRIDQLEYNSYNYTILDTLLDLLFIIDDRASLKLICNSCSSVFESEDLLQYFESAGFEDFNIFKDLKVFKCLECGSDNLLILSIIKEG